MYTLNMQVYSTAEGVRGILILILKIYGNAFYRLLINYVPIHQICIKKSLMFNYPTR